MAGGGGGRDGDGVWQGGKRNRVSCGLLQTIWCSRLIALCLIHGKVYYDMAFGFGLNTDRLGVAVAELNAPQSPSVRPVKLSNW